MNCIKTEADFEHKIRNLITARVVPQVNGIIMLTNKSVSDIILCKETDITKLFFIELKFYTQKHGRIGFGEQDGTGIQPEILKKRPQYFEKHLRWVFGRENDDMYHILTNADCVLYFANGTLSRQKQNNFQLRLYDKTSPYNEDQLIEYLICWLSESNEVT